MPLCFSKQPTDKIKLKANASSKLLFHSFSSLSHTPNSSSNPSFAQTPRGTVQIPTKCQTTPCSARWHQCLLACQPLQTNSTDRLSLSQHSPSLHPEQALGLNTSAHTQELQKQRQVSTSFLHTTHRKSRLAHTHTQTAGSEEEAPPSLGVEVVRLLEVGGHLRAVAQADPPVGVGGDACRLVLLIQVVK